MQAGVNPNWDSIHAALAKTTFNLILNLWAGIRLALFLPVHAWHFRATLMQVILLVCVSLVLNAAYDAAAVWPQQKFNPAGLSYQATLYLLFFLSIAAICAARGAQNQILALATLILSVSPTTFMFYTGLILVIEKAVPAPSTQLYWAITLAYLSWHLAIVMRAIGKTLRPGTLRAAAAMLIAYAGLNIGPWFALPPSPLWIGNPAAEMAAPAVVARTDVETLFFGQPDLLNGEIAALLPQRPGAIDLYFVGVAGHGEEDVFMNEVQFARRLFDERFDARGRSLVLVNNRSTFGFLPLANTHNLAAALAGVARRIDPAEDLLVLFATSHGEEGKGLVLDLGDFALAGLTPRLLRASLSELGDVWRVIIISACFSGGFIEELRDPRALIITSARADRSSFGCGHNGEFTYFGEEFLGRSLREEDSFIAAFDGARERIIARETAEKRTPSEPQIHVGSEIAPHLGRFVDQLQIRRPPERPPDSHGYARIKYPAGVKHRRVEAAPVDADQTLQCQIKYQCVVPPDPGQQLGLGFADVGPVHHLPK